MAYYTIPKDDRIKSYDFIEKFISDNVRDWNLWNVQIGTDTIEGRFTKTLQQMDKTSFEFLILHCGYIPDYYGKDSSQETLYSKLVEALVCEWAKRVGFVDTFLQKQKSNKEDITIKKGNSIIVCDAKSFRLGRSQAAPNVKDTIKKQAYNTWLSAYPPTQRIGGLTTFPSLHDWKKGGEAYFYYTEGNPAIMLLFYEDLAYILNQNIDAQQIIDFLLSYPNIFPKASSDKTVYWNGIKQHLFNNSYYQYKAEAFGYCKEKAEHSFDVISNMIKDIESDVDATIKRLSVVELQKLARIALIENRSKELIEQEKNIKAFRL